MPNPNSANILAGVGPSALAYFAQIDTAGPVGAAGTAGVWTATESGTPTGGGFNLSWNGYTTALIPYNATGPIGVQAALQALPHGSTITVTGSASGPYTITVPAALPQTAITRTSAFTGGSSPDIALVNGTPGTQTTTMATAPIPGGFQCAGWVDNSGLVANVSDTSTDVTGYGNTQTLRVLVSKSSRPFDIVFMETNPIVNTIYNRLPWGSTTADAQGHWAATLGPAVVATYAGIFDVVDNANHIRVYCPRLQVSSIKSRTVAASAVIQYGVTLTPLPDTNSNAVYEDYVVNALML